MGTAGRGRRATFSSVLLGFRQNLCAVCFDVSAGIIFSKFKQPLGSTEVARSLRRSCWLVIPGSWRRDCCSGIEQASRKVWSQQANWFLPKAANGWYDTISCLDP